MRNYLLESIFNYGGVCNISDDAPVYPLGEGWEIALTSLLSYPIGTKLYEIETVGTIISFFTITNPKTDKTDVWSQKLYHTAVYIDDLIELYNRNLISGLIPITEFKYQLNIFNSLLEKGCYLNKDGNIDIYYDHLNEGRKKVIIEKPKIEKFVSEYLCEPWDETYRDEMIHEYEVDNKPFIEVKNHIHVTNKGKLEFLRLSNEFEIPSRIKEIVNPLIQLKYYDTAVREIAVLIESELKSFHNTSLFGSKLIEHHVQKCINANNGVNNAGLKVYRQQLRIMNKYVRNEYMHNKINIDRINCKSILYQQSNLWIMIDQAFKKLLDE